MHRHFGTNNRAPRRAFTDPCKPEVRPGAREKSASPAWLAAPASAILVLSTSNSFSQVLSECVYKKCIYVASTVTVIWFLELQVRILYFPQFLFLGSAQACVYTLPAQYPLYGSWSCTRWRRGSRTSDLRTGQISTNIMKVLMNWKLI